MKNKLAKAGLCVLVAGMLFTSSVYAAEIGSEHSDISTTSSAFWRKKDKEAAPDTENPEASPLPSPDANSAPTVAPKDAPKEAPKENPSKESSEVTPKEEVPKEEVPKETSLVGQYSPGDAPKHSPNPNSGQTNHNHHNHDTNNAEKKHNCYMSDVSEEIQKVLAKKPGIKLDADAYIVQHDDALWLVMGNIRAKLDILIYVDQKTMAEAEFDDGNAIPLYK
ncbi:MAG: hypothetical protein FWC76_06415 [Defluviitaleaceae bacterium]|nr:hypothetical protein [Defluviitaleaceae bacterium]